MVWMIHAVAIIIVMQAARVSSWRLFYHSRLLQHLSLGGIAIIAFLWSLSAKLEQGLDIHFLAITTLTLMLGLSRTLCIGVVIVLLNQWVNDYSFAQISALYLSHIVVPATLTFISYAYIYHRLPRHPFVYIFINAFITGALCIAAAHGAHAFWAWSTGYLSWDAIWHNYLMITPLVMFPEALLNGMAVTLMVVYRPDWLQTFNDNDYLDES